MDHYSDGLFTGNFITTWTRGKAEAVYWSTGAGHQGGYAYRLCKIPAGGVTQITEECFNQGDTYVPIIYFLNYIISLILKIAKNGFFLFVLWSQSLQRVLLYYSSL